MNRRELLKLSVGALSAVALSPMVNLSKLFAAEEEPPESVAAPASLGRIATWGIQIRTDAKLNAKLVRVAKRDEVVPLLGQVVGDASLPHNSIWYKTEDGYAYSAWIQPVENITNQPEPEKAASKFWSELTVPFSDTRSGPDSKAARVARLYYSTIYHVIDAKLGPDNQWWYQLSDGITYNPGPYVLAEHMRRIDPSELTPISPNVTDKRVEVNLKDQTITAYENNEPVLTSRIASGYGGHVTPRGKHTVLYKTPTARMIGGAGDDYYDLPGVPFPTFITWTGVAIHGTYWHNDYGRPRSHGCINVTPAVALWFWRWTMPEAPYDSAWYYTPHDATATVVNVS